MDHSSTIALYIFVILWAVTWGRLAQKKRVSRESAVVRTVTNGSFFVIALVVPWFFLSFSNIGVDYEHYYDIIRKVTWTDYADYFTWEPFFLLMSVFFKTLCNGNPDMVIFIYKTITLALMGYSIYLIRNDVKLWMSIMAYMMLYYFASFYLIAMCLACSIVSFAVVLWLKRGIFIIPLALILIAGQIHNSMYLFLPVFIVGVYLKNSTKKNTLKICLITLSFIAAGILSMVIFNWAIGNIESFHYEGYTDGYKEGSGAMFFLHFGTLFFLIYEYYTINKELSDKIRFFFIFALGSALFYGMAYTFRVIGRMEFALITLYIIFMPLMFNKTIDKFKFKKIGKYQIINFICFLYVFCLGYDEVTVRIVDKDTPGLGRWIFFMPFEF